MGDILVTVKIGDDISWLDEPENGHRLLISPWPEDILATEKALSDSLEKVRLYKMCLSVAPERQD